MKLISKKSFASLLSVVLLVSFRINVSAEENYNWYFKAAGDGKQPLLLDGKEIVNHPSLLAAGNPDEKVIYLTFDAGYSTENVVKTLDVLKEENVTAAFFILPAIYKYTPEIARRMIDEGHTVCNHTLSHKNVSGMTFEQFKGEISGLEAEYEKYTGAKMAKFFRPPEGSFSENTLKYCEELGYKCVFWSFAYADWDNNAQKDREWATNIILSNIHNGEVLLLHPNSKTNADILSDVIRTLKNEGFTFGSLEKLSKYKEQRNV